MVAGVRVVMIGSFCTYLIARALDPSRANSGRGGELRCGGMTGDR